MKLTDLLKSLLTKAGVAEAEIAKITADPKIAEVDIADDIATATDKALLSLSVAKTHPEIVTALKAAAKAELYNGLDAEISDVMTEIGLTDEQKADILSEKSSTKRAALLAKKVKEYEAAAHKGSNNADKKELIDKVNALNTQISKIQKEHADAIAAKEAEITTKLLNKDLEFDLLGFNYALPKDTPASVKLAAARASLDARLNEKKLRVVIENGVKKVVREDGTDYHDDTNKPVSYNDFISGALAQDNLLAASDPADPADPAKTKFPHRVGKEGDDPKVDPYQVAAASDDLDNIKAYL
jgi:hypothetical protein